MHTVQCLSCMIMRNWKTSATVQHIDMALSQVDHGLAPGMWIRLEEIVKLLTCMICGVDL